MSEETVEVVRQPIAVRSQTRRSLTERLGLRFPRAAALGTRAVWRLSPHSRLRKAVIHRATQLGVEAYNREDWDAAVLLYAPNIELVTDDRRLHALGFDSLYRGREERIRVQQLWNAEWGGAPVFAPEEVVDLGDGRVLVLGQITGSGSSSGATVENEWAALITLSAGRISREQIFFDRGEALKAAGLRK